ncbi:MAG: SLC13 family permease, partial [Phycisphaeraceae bacterium]
MGWEAWATIATIGLMTVVLVRNLAGPDTVMLAGLTLLMTLGLWSDRFPTIAEAVAGFGNKAPITIGVLFVVAEGLRQTGAMSLLTQPLLGQPRSVLGAQVRLMFPVAALSAFLNNTPIVAMFMPVVNDWCKKTGLSPSKLYIPLSYAAIMGGSCTLIGTATNIVVKGMVDRAGPDDVQIGMFTISLIGVPAAVVGVSYILLVSKKLLPDRRPSVVDIDQARRYTVEMMVEPTSPIADKTIEQAGLRHLPGAYLMAIERAGQQLLAVGPDEVLRGGDRLIFVGIVDSVVDLQRIRGLVPATDQVFKLDDPRPNRRLCEAVVSPQCPLIGKTIREGRFRSVYNAVVIAVHRGGEHVRQKIGDITLRPGDTLLIEAPPNFTEENRNRRDFYLVSTVADSQPTRHNKAWIALLLLVAMVTLVTATRMELVNAALLAGGLMVALRCCSPGEARASINWRVLLMIGAALGVGRALDKTGAAASVANTMVSALEPYGPR